MQSSLELNTLGKRPAPEWYRYPKPLSLTLQLHIYCNTLKGMLTQWNSPHGLAIF